MLESSLALVGALIGIVALRDRFPPFSFSVDATSLWQGALATAPMLAYALFSLSPWGRRLAPMRRIYEVLERIIGHALSEAKLWQIVLLALAAGFGEETLFRGFFQPWMELHLTPFSALLVTALVFGLLHAMTLTYFLLTFVLALYFGWLMDVTADNLFVPMFAHALYDAVALIILQRAFRKQARAPSTGPIEPPDDVA